MKDIEILALLDEEAVVDFIVYNSLQKAVSDTNKFYTTVKFEINSVPSKKFHYLFRFEKADILILHRALQMPNKFETIDRHIIGGIEGLCLLLQRFAYPNRWKELQDQYGKHFSTLSKLFKVICSFVFTKWGQLLLNFGENIWFTQAVQNEFAAVVNEKGSFLHNCIGFIDGTARPICRTSQHQKELYSGHKRHHCLKFQSITLPNGIILHMSLPYPGRRHDAYMLRDTLMMEQLRLYCNGFVLYGDEGYPLRTQLIRPYSNTNLTQQQRIFNRQMSRLRQCVEWSFGKIIQQFAFVDFKKNQKLLLQPVGKYYIVVTLLTNAHTCIYGSQTSTYFNIEAPDIFEYFQVPQT